MLLSFSILTDHKKYFFQTFPGWKMTKFVSILFQTPQEPCNRYPSRPVAKFQGLGEKHILEVKILFY